MPLMLAAAVLTLPCTGHAAVSVKIEHLFSLRGKTKAEIIVPVEVAFGWVGKEIYVADSAGASVLIYGKNGNRVRSLPFPDGFRNVRGLAADLAGRLYLADAATKRVAVMSARGRLLSYLKLPEGQDRFPGKILLDRENNVYIADHVRIEIHVFDGKGEYLRTIAVGNWSKKPLSISDIAVDGGRIYLLDGRGGSVFVLNKAGSFISVFGTKGATRGQMASASSIAAGDGEAGEGLLFVTDTNRHAVLVFDKQGSFLDEFGGMGSDDGWFYFPSDLAILDDRLAVCDQSNNRVQVFRISQSEGASSSPRQ